jgi:hypothetical protein
MKERKYRSLTVNVNSKTLRRIDAQVLTHRPFLRRHTVHRVALELGLAALEKSPNLLVQELESDYETAAI